MVLCLKARESRSLPDLSSPKSNVCFKNKKTGRLVRPVFLCLFSFFTLKYLMSRNKAGIDFFNTHAADLAAQYNALDREAVHRDILEKLPPHPLRIFDIGAGSGADAFMFATKGHHVIASEPAATLRQLAQKAFPHPHISWTSATLPRLRCKYRQKDFYDLVTLVGVIQYLDANDRQKALQTMSEITSHNGLIEIQYPTPASRLHQYNVDAIEIRDFVLEFNNKAKGSRLEIIHDNVTPDLHGRKALNGSPLSFVSIIIKKH